MVMINIDHFDENQKKHIILKLFSNAINSSHI